MSDYFDSSYEVLSSVYQDGAFSQLKLNEVLSRDDAANTGLVTKIVYGTLENDGYLDYVIHRLCAKRPQSAVVVVLKIALYLLKFGDGRVPQYAVVNNAVNFMRRIGKGGNGGFVNAVLKNYLREDIPLPTETIMRMAVQYSYPEWVVRECIADYGEELAERILSERGSGRTSIRRNGNAVSQADFERLLQKNHIEYHKTGVKDTYYVSHSTMQKSNISNTYYTNQAISSVLVCRGMEVVSGSSVLDACAAPGGKSVLLAEENREGSVTACDIHAHRVKLIQSYAARMGVRNVETCVRDASKYFSAFRRKFDYVLCDVPCSGFGVVQDRPDIKLKRKEEDIASLVEAQGAILRNCAEYVRVGGYLTYATCTFLQRENSQVVRRFLSDFPCFKACNIALEIEPKYRIGEFVQLLPPLDGLSGFFMARLQRVSD